MGDYKLNVGLDLAAATRSINELANMIAQLEQRLSRLGSASQAAGQNAMQNPEFRSALTEYSAAQGAMAALKSSAGHAVTGGSSNAVKGTVVGGASAALKAMNDIPSGLGVDSYVSAVKQASQMAGQSYTPAFNINSFAAAIMASAVLPNSPHYQTSVTPPMVASGRAFGMNQPVAGPVPALGPSGMTPAQQNLVNMAMASIRKPPLTADQMLLRGTAAYGATNALSGGLGLYASQTASGEYDPMEAAGLIGGNVMGAAGAIIGAMSSPGAPGAGAATGYLMGNQIGSATAQAVMSHYIRARTMKLDLASVAARMGVSPSDLVQAGTSEISLFRRGNQQPAGPGLSALAASISEEGKTPFQLSLLKTGLYPGTDIISGPKLAQTYATIGSALLASGENPAMALNPSAALARKYGMAAPAMAKMASSVLAGRNEEGRNNTDLLLRFGPEAYGAFTDMTDAPDLTPSQLKAFKAIQSSDWNLRKASLQPRGASSTIAGIFRNQMSELSTLPGGDKSLAYAQASAGARAAERGAFDESSISTYDLPRTALETAKAIANAGPFSPGNVFGLTLESIRLNRRRIGELRGFMGSRRASGDLSAQEELELTGQIGGLMTENARAVSALAEGGANRMLALSAGRPAFAARMDSPTLASLFLGRAGSPRRNLGAANGAVLRWQDNVTNRMLDVDPEDLRPTGRNSRLNPAAPGGGGDNSRMENLLERILHALQSGSGQRTDRNGEITGGMREILRERKPRDGDVN